MKLSTVSEELMSLKRKNQQLEVNAANIIRSEASDVTKFAMLLNLIQENLESSKEIVNAILNIVSIKLNVLQYKQIRVFYTI